MVFLLLFDSPPMHVRLGMPLPPCCPLTVFARLSSAAAAALQMNYNNKNLVAAMLVAGYDKLNGGQVGIL
jgi:hypothetical protein